MYCRMIISAVVAVGIHLSAGAAVMCKDKDGNVTFEEFSCESGSEESQTSVRSRPPPSDQATAEHDPNADWQARPEFVRVSSTSNPRIWHFAAQQSITTLNKHWILTVDYRSPPIRYWQRSKGPNPAKEGFMAPATNCKYAEGRPIPAEFHHEITERTRSMVDEDMIAKIRTALTSYGWSTMTCDVPERWLTTHMTLQFPSEFSCPSLWTSRGESVPATHAAFWDRASTSVTIYSFPMREEC